MKLLRFFVFLGSLLISQVVIAESAVNDGRVFARKTLGEVHRIDLAEREAVISGFRYYFGSVITGDDSKISMLGYSTGSFELLEPGMKLLIYYAETGVSRYVISAEQLPYSTDIHARETRNRLLN